VLLVVVAVAYAWVVGGLRSFTTAALVGVFVPVVVLGVAGVVVPRRARAAALTRRAAGWLVPALAFAVLELVDLYVWHSSYEHPSLSILLDHPLESHPVRALAVFGWLVAGWGLIRR
jgi:hypothetical protein